MRRWNQPYISQFKDCSSTRTPAGGGAVPDTLPASTDTRISRGRDARASPKPRPPCAHAVILSALSRVAGARRKEARVRRRRDKIPAAAPARGHCRCWSRPAPAAPCPGVRGRIGRGPGEGRRHSRRVLPNPGPLRTQPGPPAGKWLRTPLSGQTDRERFRHFGNFSQKLKKNVQKKSGAKKKDTVGS